MQYLIRSKAASSFKDCLKGLYYWLFLKFACGFGKMSAPATATNSQSTSPSPPSYYFTSLVISYFSLSNWVINYCSSHCSIGDYGIEFGCRWKWFFGRNSESCFWYFPRYSDWHSWHSLASMRGSHCCFEELVCYWRFSCGCFWIWCCCRLRRDPILQVLEIVLSKSTLTLNSNSDFACLESMIGSLLCLRGESFDCWQGLCCRRVGLCLADCHKFSPD